MEFVLKAKHVLQTPWLTRGLHARCLEKRPQFFTLASTAVIHHTECLLKHLDITNQCKHSLFSADASISDQIDSVSLFGARTL